MDGTALVVGVAGSTITECCGYRGVLVVDAIELDDVDDALECVWWWWWIDRTEETDDDVDFLPRSPADGRRNEERGVTGDGDNELRF